MPSSRTSRLEAGKECAILVTALLSTEPDPTAGYFSVRERQARALAARLLLPTLNDIVRGAEAEAVQQVENLLVQLALQGPNGRALAISMLYTMVENQGAIAAGPLSRERVILTRLARVFLQLMDGVFDGPSPGVAEWEAIAACLNLLQPALERGGKQLLTRLNDRLFPVLLKCIPLSPAMPSVVRLWLSYMAQKMFVCQHCSPSIDAKAIFQWYRDSVHPRLREALFELLFRMVVAKLEFVDHESGDTDTIAPALGDIGATTHSRCDMFADVTKTLHLLRACGMARDLARRPQLLTPSVLERVINERLTEGDSKYIGVARNCAMYVLDNWHSSFVEPLFEPCDESECGCLDDGPVCCARRVLLRAAQGSLHVDSRETDTKIDSERRIAAECWLSRSIMLLKPTKCGQGGDSGNESDTDELQDKDTTAARHLFVELAHDSDAGGRDTFVRVLRASVFQELGCEEFLDGSELELSGEATELITSLLHHASAACNVLAQAAVMSLTQTVLCVDMLCELLLLLLPRGQRTASGKKSDLKRNAHADTNHTSSDAIDADETACAEVLRLLSAQGTKACHNFQRADLISSSFLCKAIESLQLRDDENHQAQNTVLDDARAASLALLVLRCRKSGDAFDEVGGAGFFEPLTRSNHDCVARFASDLMLHRQRIEKPEQHQCALRSVLRESQLRCDTSLLDCPKRLYHACATATESEEVHIDSSESLDFTACLDADLASSFAAGLQMQHSS